MRCSRRRCLGVLVVGAGMMTFASLVRADESEVRQLLLLVQQRPEASRIGRECASVLQRGALEIEHLFAERLRSEGKPHESGQSLIQKFDDAVRVDFASGDLLSLHGWPVSRTEALAYVWAYNQTVGFRR